MWIKNLSLNTGKVSDLIAPVTSFWKINIQQHSIILLLETNGLHFSITDSLGWY